MLRKTFQLAALFTFLSVYSVCLINAKTTKSVRSVSHANPCAISTQQNIRHRTGQRGLSNLGMKWSFQKSNSGGAEISNVGIEGELYFHPAKIASIKGAPPKAVGKPITMPILPYNHPLLPHATEWIHVFEMRYRQMMYDLGEDGKFGILYYSQKEQKLALTGTIARVKSKKMLEDGRTFVVAEGVSRFYMNKMTAEKPYYKASVTPFQDYSLTPSTLDMLEGIIFDEVRINVRLMQVLFPGKNFTISNSILESKPVVKIPGVRLIQTVDDAADLERRTRFSFAVLDMLQTSPQTKLSILQEHVLEKRYGKLIKILEKGGAYMRSELIDKGLMTEDEIRSLKYETLSNIADLEVLPTSSWHAENFVNGEWQQSVTMM